jgi:hypothetical protein
LRNLAVDWYRRGHAEDQLQEPDEVAGSDHFEGRIGTSASSLRSSR